MKIYFAPLQGFTDRVYRILHAKHFNSVDAYFTPYIEYQNNGEIKNSHKRDVKIISELEQVPQVLCNNAEHLLGLGLYLKKLDYSEANLNLGCPYPMVAKRKKGSGILPFPDEIQKMLLPWFENPPLELSVKLRLGYETKDEIYRVFDVLNKFAIKEIILHPRIGKNLYKGKVDIDAFENAIQYSKHRIIYNGDIDSIEKFNELSERFKTIDNWMIGRALLGNPFFAEEIISGQIISFEEKNIRLKAFVADLWQAYEKQYGHPSQALNKMKQQWIYLSQMFENPRKTYKLIKKSVKVETYNKSIKAIFYC